MYDVRCLCFTQLLVLLALSCARVVKIYGCRIDIVCSSPPGGSGTGLVPGWTSLGDRYTHGAELCVAGSGTKLAGGAGVWMVLVGVGVGATPKLEWRVRLGVGG